MKIRPGGEEREEGWKIKRDKQRVVGEELFPRGITLGVSLHWSF